MQVSSTKHSFINIFHNLQALHIFAPLKAQRFMKIRQHFAKNGRIFANFFDNYLKFVVFRADVDEHLSEFREPQAKFFEIL